MTPQERADDLFLARMFKRPTLNYILDKPFYPYVPNLPKKCVNYDLNTPTVCFDLNYN